jgi:hypothetical protein
MRITESQLRRIIRMSRYGLYGDDQDALFDSVLVPLARAVVA